MTAIVELVLDAEQLDDGSTRILVQGVFPRGAELPPMLPAGRPHVERVDRNVVQVFYGVNMRSVPAFRVFPGGSDD
jgi:hypothetical protein